MVLAEMRDICMPIASLGAKTIKQKWEIRIAS
jgi:hypothetical protein